MQRMQPAVAVPLPDHVLRDQLRRPDVQQYYRDRGLDPDSREAFEDLKASVSERDVWKNDKYTAFINEAGSVGDVKFAHLSIKRNDKEPIHDWRDLQQIKSDLFGEESEAAELYPAASRTVDSANQYHLWVLIGQYPDVGFPFGFTERLVTDDVSTLPAKQRPFEIDVDDPPVLNLDRLKRALARWRTDLGDDYGPARLVITEGGDWRVKSRYKDTRQHFQRSGFTVDSLLTFIARAEMEEPAS